MAKKVRDAMTVEPRSAEPGLSLAEAAQLMKSEDVGSLPVVGDGHLVAVLTDRDIVVRAVAEGVDPNAIVVGDVASRGLVTVDPEQDLDEALALMARHQVRRLPVVEQDRLVGIIAQADVAHGVRAKQAGEVVEEISKPTGGRVVSSDTTRPRNVIEPPPPRPDPQPEPPPEPIPDPTPEPEPPTPRPGPSRRSSRRESSGRERARQRRIR